MKHLLITLAFAGLLVACGGPSAAEKEAEKAEKEAVMIDSIANKIDQSAQELKKEAQDVEASVDALLEE